VKSLAAFICSLALCGTLRAGDTVRVAAAVSLSESMNQIARQYENESGDRVELTFGSSGQLAAQIQSGAPVDAFISAANKQVDDLAKAGLIDEASRRVVVGNALVLIVPPKAVGAPESFVALAEASVRRVAIGEPKTVPAGQYAQQVLRALNLIDKLGDRIVYGANVRQVLDYVIRGEVSAGIVYRTDALEAGDKVKVVATAEEKWHEPIVYPAAIIRSSRKCEAAKKFLDYLGSEKAQSILRARGFTPASHASP
jgi:molybdate transport system substrate-binding protein